MRTRRFLILTVALAVLMSAGCATNNRGRKASLQTTLMQMARNPHIEDEYIIDPPDNLGIEVKGYPEYSREVSVRPDGKITVTSIGDVHVQGLTVMAAAAKIQEALLKELSNPSVTVTLLAANSKAVYVLGEVRRPGRQPYFGDMYLVDALGAAAGLTMNADAGKVQLTRANLEKAEIFKINLRKLVYKGQAQHNVMLQNGDIIYVPPTGFAKVGYAMNQLLYPFRAVLGGLTTYGATRDALDDPND